MNSSLKMTVFLANNLIGQGCNKGFVVATGLLQRLFESTQILLVCPTGFQVEGLDKSLYVGCCAHDRVVSAFAKANRVESHVRFHFGKYYQVKVSFFMKGRKDPILTLETSFNSDGEVAGGVSSSVDTKVL